MENVTLPDGAHLAYDATNFTPPWERRSRSYWSTGSARPHILVRLDPALAARYRVFRSTSAAMVIPACRRPGFEMALPAVLARSGGVSRWGRTVFMRIS